MKTLGAILKESRDMNGLTLREVEEKTGLSNAYVSQLENDKIKKPSANVLYKLSKLYHVKLDGLLRAAGVIEKSEEDERRAEGEVAEVWMSNIAFYSESLTPEQQSQILDYVKFLKSQKK